MITINGKDYKELRCKFDSCRSFIVYERVKIGRLCFVCPKCKYVSEYEFTMLKTKENIDTINDELITTKGGEI